MSNQKVVSSSFKPPSLVRKVARWTLEGFSWISLERVGENCDSPELFRVGGVGIGLRVMLKSSEPEHVSVYVYVRGSSGDYGLEISIQLLSQRPSAPDVCGRMNKGSVRLVNGTFRTTARPNDLNEDWGFTQFLRRDAADFYCKNDAMIFELAVLAWSKDPAAEQSAVEVEDDTARRSSAQLPGAWGRLLSSGELADVELLPSGDGGGCMAHKLVLAARSPVLKQMFFGVGMQEAAEARPKVQVSEMDHDIMVMFLHALYTDEIQADAWANDEVLCHLYAAFHKYQVDDLMKRCEARIIALFSEEVVAERLMMADLLDAAALRQAALDYMTAPEQLPNVQATEGFQRLIEQRPKILAEVLARSIPPAAKKARTKGPDEIPSLEELKVATLSTLKSLCSEHGLRVTGTKAELIDRLRGSTVSGATGSAH